MEGRQLAVLPDRAALRYFSNSSSYWAMVCVERVCVSAAERSWSSVRPRYIRPSVAWPDRNRSTKPTGTRRETKTSIEPNPTSPPPPEFVARIYAIWLVGFSLLPWRNLYWSCTAGATTVTDIRSTGRAKCWLTRSSRAPDVAETLISTRTKNGCWTAKKAPKVRKYRCKERAGARCR